MKDHRIGKCIELHPAVTSWMRGDRFGTVLRISKRARNFLDPKDPRNGHTFTVKMHRSGQTIRVSEGNIYRLF